MADKLCFEDFPVGRVFDVGGASVTEAEILAFARQFDPQPFHIDPDAAKKSIFGGIIASGWHTASIAMRLQVDGILSKSHSMGSPGIDQLRWLKPVRPGDALSCKITVLEAKPSHSKPDRGSVKCGYELKNQKGEVV